MPSLLTYADLHALAREREAIMSGFESDDELSANEDVKFRAWGVEPRAVIELGQWAAAGVPETAPSEATDDDTLVVTFLAGFDLGFRAALEVANRQAASG